MYIKINKQKKDFDASTVTIIDKNAKFKASNIEAALLELYEMIQAVKEENETNSPSTDKSCTSLSIEKTEIDIDYVDDGIIELTVTPLPVDTTDELEILANTMPSVFSAAITRVNNSYKLTIVPLSMGNGFLQLICGTKVVECEITIAGSSRPKHNITYVLNNVKLDKTPVIIKEGETIVYNIITPKYYAITDIAILYSINDQFIDILDEVYDRENKTITLSDALGDIYIEIQAGPDDILDNPTMSIENHKAKLEQDGFVQYFNVSYAENLIMGDTGLTNSGHQYFEGENNEVYYLALVVDDDISAKHTPFRILGTVPYGGGWMSINDSEGNLYDLGKYAFPTYTNWDFTCGIKKLGTGVVSELFDPSLDYFNSAFDALNIYEDQESSNTIAVESYDDTWLGQCTRTADHFEIKINITTLSNNYGPLAYFPRPWISTTVHELGHTLGLRDNAAHFPSMYDYSRNREQCLYLQPNDLHALEFLYIDTYGIDIMLAQENIFEQAADKPMILNQFLDGGTPEIELDYDLNMNNIKEKSNLIVDAELIYNRTEVIEIGPNCEMEYDIYKIIDATVVKGELINNELKIPTCGAIDISPNTEYRLYLQQYENVPCSLMNPKRGIIKL